MSNCDSDPWTCDQTPFFAKKSQNSEKNYCIFPGKGRGNMALILQCLDSPMAKFFHRNIYFYWFWPSSGEKWEGDKVEPKVQTLGMSHFWKKLNFSKILKTQFLPPLILPLVKLSAKLGNIWKRGRGGRPPIPPKKGHFMDAESVQKTLKIYNLTTTYGILVKLTTIMYLHKTFHFTEKWGVTHRA